MSRSLLCAAVPTAAAPGARAGDRRLPAHIAAGVGGGGFRGVGGVGFNSTRPLKAAMPQSLLCTAVATAAAATPGARGGDRRLPASRAAGGVGFTLVVTPKARDTMLACAKGTQPSSSMGEEEFDSFYNALCKQTETMFSLFILFPVALTEEEKAVQIWLKEIAEKSLELLRDSMRRLRPEQRHPLYPLLRSLHLAFTMVKFRAMAGHAHWGQSSVFIVEKLDVLRKMVSSACNTPLPLDKEKALSRDQENRFPPLVEEVIGGHGVANDLSVVTFVVVEMIYNTVKSDIDKMIAASATTTS